MTKRIIISECSCRMSRNAYPICDYSREQGKNEQARTRVISGDNISNDMKTNALKSTSNKRDGSSYSPDVKLKRPLTGLERFMSKYPDYKGAGEFI